MRVRMAQKRMSVKEADLLQYYLEGFEFIRKADAENIEIKR